MIIEFQQVKITDVPTLIEMMKEFYEYDHIVFHKDAALSALSKLVENSNYGYAWLIIENQSIIGYVVLTIGYSLEFQGRDAFLDELFIKAEHRGKGIGQQAIKFIEQQCKDIGIKAFHLEVERQNKTAHGLYKKMGFKEHDRYLMTKWLTNSTD